MKKVGQRVADLDKVTWRKSLREGFFSVFRPRKSKCKLSTGDLRRANVCCKSGGLTPTRLCANIEETHAEQPTTQSRSQRSQSEDHSSPKGVD